MTGKITIAIAEDQHLFRKGLIALLDSIPDFDVVIEGENGADLLQKVIAKKGKPDIYLVDLRMPVMDGKDLTVKLKEEQPNARIIIVSAHDDQDIIVHLYENGANAFIDKNAEPKEIELAIREVMKNGFYINGMAQKALQEASAVKTKTKTILSYNNLTHRDIEIMKLICFEKNSTEIAKRLSLSKRTVENHRYKLMRKIDVKNSAGIVLLALKLKIIELAELKIKNI